MTVVRRPFWNLATALSLLVLLPSAARAVAWMDDFNDGNVTDGNPVTWIEDLGGSGNFPGTYDASSGDYHLIDPTGPSEQMISLVPTSFNDVYMRTQGVILPGALPEQDAGNLALLARVDTATLSAYTVYFDTEFNLGLQVLAGGDDLVDINVDIPFSAVSEVVLEFNVVGNALSAFVWEVGQPKPAEPQITYIDESNLLTSGLVGIGADDEGEDTTAVYRFVAAQDTPFVDVNPSNGDFDGDSDVDGEDFLIWQRGLGLTGQPNASTGDADGDGDVDAADLGLWQANFGGAPMVAAITAVPEPATCSSGAAALLALAVLRRRNN